MDKMSGLDGEMRAFIRMENKWYPTLADLPTRYFRIPPNQRYSAAPHCLVRHDLLVWYRAWAPAKPWARKGLVNLISRHVDQGKRIPGILVDWSLDVTTGNFKSPRRRGRPANDDRNDRIVYAHRLLRADGLTVEQAIEKIANVIYLTPEAVRAAIRKVKKDRLPTMRRPGYGYSMASVGPPPDLEEHTLYCMERSGFAIFY